MSLISDALSAGFSAIEDMGGERVTYRRGSQEITDVLAVRDHSDFDERASEETHVQIKTTDFLIRLKYLVDSNYEEVTPSRGDQIVSGDGETFDLVPGVDNKHWRWSDARKTHYRIFTVRRKAGSG